LEELRAIPICSAPPPADTHVLDLNTIVSALRVSGVPLANLKLAGSTRVLINRQYDLVSVQELKRAFTDHVVERTKWPRSSFLVEPPKNLDAIPVPPGTRRIQADTGPDEDFCGSVFVRFQILIDGKPYSSLAHRFVIERYVPALVATRKIHRGQTVSATDVEVTNVEQSRIDDETLTAPEQGIGLMAIRSIPAGKILSSDLVRTAPVVERGEYAPVVWEGNGFHIMTRGRVLDEGRREDIVRVRLPTRKIMRAVVLDADALKLVKEE
jgi:flagella basal body P-ring formation protein FlgA